MWSFPGGKASGKELAYHCRRCKGRAFDLWVGNIPWQPTSVFLPGESHGQRSLVDYSPWGRKALQMTEAAQHTQPSLSSPLGKINSRWILWQGLESVAQVHTRYVVKSVPGKVMVPRALLPSSDEGRWGLRGVEDWKREITLKRVDTGWGYRGLTRLLFKDFCNFNRIFYPVTSVYGRKPASLSTMMCVCPILTDHPSDQLLCFRRVF